MTPEFTLTDLLDNSVERDPDAVVIEDAVSGVVAGAAGGFGLVIGVARHEAPDDLLAAGAHVVVSDLAEVSVVAPPG